jgi:hypothetical protein
MMGLMVSRSDAKAANDLLGATADRKLLGRLGTVLSPFDGFGKRTVVSSWIKTFNARPLNFVVTLHSITTVITRLDAQACIFEETAVKFLRGTYVIACVGAALAFEVALSDIPVCFQFPPIVSADWNQEIRAAKADKKNEHADQVFVRRSTVRFTHNPFHAAISKKLHPTVELTGPRRHRAALPEHA